MGGGYLAPSSLVQDTSSIGLIVLIFLSLRHLIISRPEKTPSTPSNLPQAIWVSK